MTEIHTGMLAAGCVDNAPNKVMVAGLLVCIVIFVVLGLPTTLALTIWFCAVDAASALNLTLLISVKPIGGVVQCRRSIGVCHYANR